MERHNEVVKLRESGLSYHEIGHMLGISRQRVEQIVKDRPIKHYDSSKVMLTVKDVVYLLGIHSNTVRRWSDQGILKSYCISARGDRRFKREDIDRFLEERRVGGNQ